VSLIYGYMSILFRHKIPGERNLIPNSHQKCQE